MALFLCPKGHWLIRAMRGTGKAAPVALHGEGGYSLSRKRVSPFKSPERKVCIGSLKLEGVRRLWNGSALRGGIASLAAIASATRLDLLLLSAAALPIFRRYRLITVYRQPHQCGERSNAASDRQSVAEKTSLAPHDSKARLISVTTRRRFMAKPCTPHYHSAG